MKKALACMLFVACLLLAACSGGEEQPESNPVPPPGVATAERRAVVSGVLQFTTPQPGDTVAEIATTKGTIYVVLYPDKTPLAVENFARLAEQGYYAGTVFHRVQAGFLIQGGDATGTGLGGQSIWGVPFATERSDKLHHYAGALCMAAADGEADTHASQFYIVASSQGNLDEAALAQLSAAGLREEVVDAYRQAGGAPYLDNTDTVFGQVYAGMDVVDAIAAAKADADGRPEEPVEVTGIVLSTYDGPGVAVPDASAAESAPGDVPVSQAEGGGSSVPVAEP